jgi:hypothetical protein
VVKVIFCYTHQPEPKSAEAVTRYAPLAEWVDTSPSIYAYNEIIASLWTGTDDLVVIEGDKEITAEVLPSFEHCSELWCSFSYYVFPEAIEIEVSNGLGCTRYSARLQRIVDPAEFTVADNPMWELCRVCNGKGCWRYLDTRIAQAIRMHLTPTVDIDVCHHGRVNHHHDYSGQMLEVAGSLVSAEVLDDRLLTIDLQRVESKSAEESLALDRLYAGPGWKC